MQESLFYDQLNIVKKSSAFSGYARSYKVEIINYKDPLIQLEASKSSIKDLFRDLLNEIKGFLKYKLTMTILLSKAKTDGSTEHSSVYFNSTTKTVINYKFNLSKSFQEILYRTDNWINEGSGWVIESINGQYLNVSFYNPLVGITYTELPNKLKHPMKGLINIQIDDNRCFLWCHITESSSAEVRTRRQLGNTSTCPYVRFHI